MKNLLKIMLIYIVGAVGLWGNTNPLVYKHGSLYAYLFSKIDKNVVKQDPSMFDYDDITYKYKYDNNGLITEIIGYDDKREQENTVISTTIDNNQITSAHISTVVSRQYKKELADVNITYSNGEIIKEVFSNMKSVTYLPHSDPRTWAHGKVAFDYNGSKLKKITAFDQNNKKIKEYRATCKLQKTPHNLS